MQPSSKLSNSIGVATGEMCCNRVIFKQFLQSHAMQFCRIDAARIGGFKEILNDFKRLFNGTQTRSESMSTCGRCGALRNGSTFTNVGLCGTLRNNALIEYVDQQHEHFVTPVVVENARYKVPKRAGYSTTFTPETIPKYEYRNGTEWQLMFSQGLFADPRKHKS